MSRPLDGLLVVSLEQAIAAPYCTRLLADQGARVIKVERPDGGDFARAYDTRTRGLASHFVWTNRSKESLALDLKDDARDRRAAADHRARPTCSCRTSRRAPSSGSASGRRSCARPTRASSPARSPATARGGPAGQAQSLRSADPGGGRFSVGHRQRATRWPRPASRSPTSRPASPPIIRSWPRSSIAARPDGATTSRCRCWRPWPNGWAFPCISPSTAPRRRRATAPAMPPSTPMAPTTRPTAASSSACRTTANGRLSPRPCCERPDLAADPRFKGNAGRANHRGLLEPVISGVLSALATEEAIARLEQAGIATARVNDMAALWDASAAQGARSLARIRLAGRAASRSEAGQRRRLGAALRSGAGARRAHRGDPRRIRLLRDFSAASKDKT